MKTLLNPQVLIVGAGPTGLTLACELARRGVEHRIIEKSPEPFVGSRGKGLQPRTLEIFETMGVVDAMLAAGGPYPPLRAYAGTRVAWEGYMHEPSPPVPEVPYPNGLMLPQWRTEELLRARHAASGGRVEFGTELAGFEQDAEGVTVTLIQAGQTEQVRARYVVGADGGRSFVRKHLGVSFEGETHETERMLIGDVQANGLDREHWHMWGNLETRTLRAGLCPLPGTNVFQFTAPLAADEEPELSLEAMQRMFDAASGRSDVRLHNMRWVSLYRVNIRMVDRYRVGRIFLAGDAAHVHSPTGAQGLNTGVQDAFNLGWKLAQVLAGAPEALLDTYEEERLPVAAGVLGLSTRLLRKSLQGDPDAYRRGPELNQLGLHYRGSSIVRDARPAPSGLQAGDRAPDAPCHDGSGAPKRLFELFRGTHSTLLAFGAAQADLLSQLDARYGPDVRAHLVVRPGDSASKLSVIDSQGHAFRAYSIDSDMLVLVRPDGYVGCVTPPSSVDVLDDHLRLVSAQPIRRPRKS
ncbi:FAD-dependent oxidoreductase [Hyalangium versicolor]|uniref:FAD-dependent oxidoreductase n=1 Tax=Hyalangium versicolor TaxID=2861190 RepID=UPI001CCC3988|nr:FAD-dependent oxidoreductase [Hyalangium versicolor]